MKPTINNVRNVYFSGIGGIGMSSLAKYFLALNKNVSGSDLVKSEITTELEELGVKVKYEQVESNINDDIDLFVFSAAVPESNPERKMASNLKLKQRSYVEALGDLSKLYKTIAVSGTNGKSTTTAMIAGILIDAGLDPTVIFGSKDKRINGNFHQGKSDNFLVEACEYRGHLLHLTPQTIILTNIEEEHLDYFTDLNHIIETFQQFVDKLGQPDNMLVYNKDDVNLSQLHLPNCNIVSYGINEVADVMAKNIQTTEGKQTFDVEYQGDLGQFEIMIPGKFNVFNALAAISYSLALGVKVDIIKNSLKNFNGIWRRFEVLHDDEITVVSDYAHHPTALKSTIRAAKEFYPKKRLVVVFQPHQHQRTHKLFKNFVEALYEADVIILPEIYEVAGRDRSDEHDISSKDLVKAIKARWPEKKTLFAKNNEQALDLANFNIKPHDVVLVIGAGNIYTIADKIELAT